MTGEIRPSSGDITHYPYTHKSTPYGWSSYNPIESAHVLLYEHDALKTIICVDPNQELMEHLRKHPDLLKRISPWQFEEVVASIFRNQRFEVELTPAARDGGIDLYAARNDIFGNLLYVIECKRYRSTRKVGIIARSHARATLEWKRRKCLCGAAGGGRAGYWHQVGLMYCAA